MADPSFLTGIFRYLARFLRAYPLLQIATGALLWAPICVGLQIVLEKTGYLYPVDHATGGLGVRITAAGMAVLLGASVAWFKNRKVRADFRKKAALARDNRAQAKVKAAEAESDAAEKARIADDAGVEKTILEMTDEMREVLKGFVDRRRKYYVISNQVVPKRTLGQLEDTGWITYVVDHTETRVYLDEAVFRRLIANPNWAGSSVQPTKTRWAVMRG